MPKRCKNCKEKFESNVFLMKYCDSDPCMKAFWLSVRKEQENKRKKKAVASRRVTKKKIEELEPLRYWIRKAQKQFNTYIRARDKGKPCISCNQIEHKGNLHQAGHYYSTSVAPELRFEELNTHGQCTKCNMHLSANLIPYSENLPKRIGLEAFARLKEKKGQRANLGKSDLKEMIETYKQKLKDLK